MARTGKQPRQGDIERWREFANQYIIDFKAAASVERCHGYTATGNAATVTAARLLANPSVQEFIREAIEARNKRLELSQDVVVKEHLRIALSDLRDYMTWDGRNFDIKPDHVLTDDQAAALQNIEIYQAFDEEGNLKVQKAKVNLWSKHNSLEALGRHLGLYEKDNVHTIKDDRQSQIDSVMDILRQTKDRITPEADEDGDAD